MVNKTRMILWEYLFFILKSPLWENVFSLYENKMVKYN